MKPSRHLLLPAFVSLLAAAPANACTVCMGDPQSDWAGASNAVLWFLLGFTFFCFGGTGAFAFYLYRRNKTLTAPETTAGHIIKPATDLA